VNVRNVASLRSYTSAESVWLTAGRRLFADDLGQPIHDQTWSKLWAQWRRGGRDPDPAL